MGNLWRELTLAGGSDEGFHYDQDLLRFTSIYSYNTAQRSYCNEHTWCTGLPGAMPFHTGGCDFIKKYGKIDF